MNRLWVVILLAFALTACTAPLESENPGGEFVMTVEQVNSYKQLVKESLDKEYWTYDLDTVTFEDGVITSKDDENYQAIYESSLASGYAIDEAAGQNCVTATVPLYYLNGDPAGRAVFGIQNDKIMEAYYLDMAGRPTSLGNKNSYLIPLEIPEAAETPQRLFQERILRLPVDAARAMFNPETSELFCFDEATLRIYYFQEEKFNELKRKDFVNGIIDIAFISDKLTAVLTLKEDFSKELILCDENLNQVGSLELEQNYSAVQAYEGGLLLAAGGRLEVYSTEANELVLERQRDFDCGIIDMEIVSLGTEKMLAATDGVDTYLFSYEDAELLWRTHMPIGNSIERLSAADLDGDGLHELFVQDRQVSVHYIFTDEGLRSQDDIYTGVFILGDFNRDGKDDYISGDALYW